MQKTQQVSKPANKPAKASSKPAKAEPNAAKVETKAKPTTPAKVETKAAPKAETKATPFFAALYVAIKAGKFGALALNYYKRADAYHSRVKTVFPRQRTEFDRADITKAKAEEVIKRASLGTLAAGAADGQAVYDLMRMGADCAK
jgi:hypothetical protein